MDVVMVQLDTAWHDKAANFERVRRLLQVRPPAAGALVVLPEMFATGFSMDVPAIAEGPARPAERFCAEIARQYQACVLAGVVNIGPDGRGRNQALAVGPDGAELLRYDKIHPFRYGGEADHYAGGTEVRCIDWQGARVCPFVCYDLRFPEVFRRAVRGGAEVFAVIANWPEKRQGHWATLLAARAIENLACVVGVNRCGRDPHHVYAGGSAVIDHQGRTVCVAEGEEAAGANIDIEALRAWRKEFLALQDMRG